MTNDGQPYKSMRLTLKLRPHPADLQTHNSTLLNHVAEGPKHLIGLLSETKWRANSSN